MSTIRLSSLIGKAWHPVARDVFDHGHTHYSFSGGRGSLKSSTVSLLTPLLLATHPDAHALVLRKVGNTLRDSVYAQYIWAIGALGMADYWTTKVSPMELIYRPTGQRIMFRGADDPMKIKSIKAPFGYFSQDITGHDFMADIAAQVADYWDAVDQATLLAILEGIFGVSTNSFNVDHTLDITAESEPTVGAFTLNSAIQKAAGANKDIFTVVVMHSVVATNLENLQLLEYMKYSDGEGIQRDLSLATWNGRTVLVDDDVPVEDVAAAGNDPAYRKYTTYILGAGAFDYCDCGAAVPAEIYRDPTTKGGQSMLITRQRKLFAPRGFSFVQPSAAIISPTDAQLKTAGRWTPVTDTAGTGYFDTKAMPFARIISRG